MDDENFTMSQIEPDVQVVKRKKEEKVEKEDEGQFHRLMGAQKKTIKYVSIA